MIVALRDVTSRHDAGRSLYGRSPRRDFLLGLRHGQLVRAQVPSWCSGHGVDAGCSQRAGPPGQLTTRGYQTPAEGTGWTPPAAVVCQSEGVAGHFRRRPWTRWAPSDSISPSTSFSCTGPTVRELLSFA